MSPVISTFTSCNPIELQKNVLEVFEVDIHVVLSCKEVMSQLLFSLRKISFFQIRMNLSILEHKRTKIKNYIESNAS